MDQQEEKALVQGLVRMDEHAWEKFCREYSLPLLNFIQYRFGCNGDESEDVVQMSFVRCVRSIGSFDPRRGRLFEWLKAVARNEARRMIRNDHRTGFEVVDSFPHNPAPSQIPEIIDNSPLPDELVEHSETRWLVQETLLELNARQREVLTLKYLEELKIVEIAKRLHSSEKAIESLLTRAREAFRKVFHGKLRENVSERIEAAK